MKNLALLLLISGIIFASACKKDTKSERFKLLTGHVWTSDSLLAEGVDASGPGQMLEKFKGDAKFNEDGSGYFGKYSGKWRFSSSETTLIIMSDSLQLPLSTNLVELTIASLKVTTSYLIATNLIDIRMTFKAK